MSAGGFDDEVDAEDIGSKFKTKIKTPSKLNRPKSLSKPTKPTKPGVPSDEEEKKIPRTLRERRKLKEEEERQRKEERKQKFKKPEKKLKDVDFENVRATGMRNIQMVIREAARKRLMVNIEYKKLTTNNKYFYILEPYSYRIRPTRIGLTKMFFGYDPLVMKNRDPKRKSPQKKTIKNFALKRIKSAMVTDKEFTPRWTVEI